MTLSHLQLLALNGIHGFGPKKIHSVVKSIQNVGVDQLNDGEVCKEIQKMVKYGILKGIKTFDSSEFLVSLEAAKRLLYQSEEKGILMVSRYDPIYPQSLLKTIDENGKESIPLLLFYRGNLSIADKKSIAIIGTRSPSPEGKNAGRILAKAFAERGINVVSGLALGCDTAAHNGALEGNGLTIATLGNGLDKIYPQENENLAERIVENGGLLLSEYSLGEEATPYSLVARDRLQAALSQSIIVIQTELTGGAMHAVNAASIVNKPIYAVEYKKNLSLNYISGNLALVHKKIAKPISCSQEDVNIILERLNMFAEQSMSLF